MKFEFNPKVGYLCIYWLTKYKRILGVHLIYDIKLCEHTTCWHKFKEYYFSKINNKYIESIGFISKGNVDEYMPLSKFINLTFKLFDE